MQFQRDPIHWYTPAVLVQHTLKYVFYRLSSNHCLAQWQTIKMADTLRILHCTKAAALMARHVFALTDNATFKFWALHVQAVAMHYANRYAESERLFIQAQPYAEARLISFNYQHYGKMLVEEGRLDEAKLWLTKALQVREEQGEPKLIASSQRALSELDELKKALFKRGQRSLA